MADLLSSLVLPNNNSSQESFHSISSQPPPDINTVPEPTTDTHDSALQAAGLPIYEAESYLTDPKNASLHEKLVNGKKSQPQSSRPARQSSETGAPVSLGSKTSHHVSALMIACQAQGLSPVFEIEGGISQADFGGILRIGSVTIASDERWHSKKEAKEALAEKGLESVKTMEGKREAAGTENGEVKNWVGMLHEYHNLIDPNRGPVYEYYSLGSAYACTCIIPSRPDQTFGSKTTPFSSKKAAYFNSAREAVEHLITEGNLNPDGSPKARKKAKLGAAVRIEGRGLEVKKGSSYAQKVQGEVQPFSTNGAFTDCNWEDLCPLLGLTSPQYTLAPASALAPNMLSGYASWPNEPGMPKEIGEVRNIFGKKNAKEEIAKEVWIVLKELAEKRGLKMEGVERAEH